MGKFRILIGTGSGEMVIEVEKIPQVGDIISINEDNYVAGEPNSVFAIGNRYKITSESPLIVEGDKTAHHFSIQLV